MDAEHFYRGIQTAYRALEKRLDEDSLSFARDRVIRYHGITDESVANRCVFQFEPEERERAYRGEKGRYIIRLSEGYVAKILPTTLFSYKYGTFVQVTIDDRHKYPNSSRFQEEETLRTFRKYGITQENGFIVPEHKIVGVYQNGANHVVNENGSFVTVTEDLTESEMYKVTDVQPWHFATLRNKKELVGEYDAVFTALLELYNNPAITVSVNRHGTVSDPKPALSRMLFVRIKDDKGQIVIGDLDNLCFSERE